jgi:helicase
LRYGFTQEIIKEIAEHVEKIDEDRIVFLPSIKNTPEFVRKMVDWYLPD